MSEIYSYATKSWPIAKGCDMSLSCAARCWASRQCHRLKDNPNAKIAAFHRGLTDERGHWTGTVKLNEAHLTDPLRWRGHQIIATAYHGDLFLAPKLALAQVFATIANCDRHQFLVLTKRSSEMLRVMPRICDLFDGPLPNVWLGVSIANQSDADERMEHLRQLAEMGWNTWASLEPLTGAVSFRWAKWQPRKNFPGATDDHLDGLRWLKWVVLGGESGRNSRPMHPDWVRSVRDQCVEAGVPFYFKQHGDWGDWAVWCARCDALSLSSYDWPKDSMTVVEDEKRWRAGKKYAGRLLDGREWLQMPEGLHA
jgi:protein gp37